MAEAVRGQRQRIQEFRSPTFRPPPLAPLNSLFLPFSHLLSISYTFSIDALFLSFSIYLHQMTSEQTYCGAHSFITHSSSSASSNCTTVNPFPAGRTPITRNETPQGKSISASLCAANGEISIARDVWI